MTNHAVISELQRIASLSNGVLLPEKVVEEAEPETSPLHSKFCWDNDKAAREYRIFQARNLIRATVRYIGINGDTRAMRVFVSLTPDREREGGGYRDVVAVMSDKDMRRQMLEDALVELGVFEVKYAHLKELTGVFVASKQARQALIQTEAA
jgi:hypothetical protein